MAGEIYSNRNAAIHAARSKLVGVGTETTAEIKDEVSVLTQLTYNTTPDSTNVCSLDDDNIWQIGSRIKAGDTLTVPDADAGKGQTRTVTAVYNGTGNVTSGDTTYTSYIVISGVLAAVSGGLSYVYTGYTVKKRIVSARLVG